MTDMTMNAPIGSARASRTPLTRRLRFGSSASGVGHAGWGRTIGAAIVSFLYFFPVFWIILTAFKTYEDALAVPAKFFFTRLRLTISHRFSAAPIRPEAPFRTPGLRYFSSTRCSSPE